MKNRNLILIIAVFVSILVIALFVSYWDASLIPKRIVKVEVVDFTMIGGGLPAIVGVIVAINFNLTVRNSGTENVSQLSINIALINNETKAPIGENNLFYYEPNNFTLTSGETSNRKIDFFIDLDTEQQMMASHQNFLATLISNGTVLGERNLLL
jgi:hypothetical protein